MPFILAIGRNHKIETSEKNQKLNSQAPMYYTCNLVIYITLFRCITVLCGTDNIPRIILWYSQHSNCQSHITLLCIWIVLCRKKLTRKYEVIELWIEQDKQNIVLISNLLITTKPITHIRNASIQQPCTSLSHIKIRESCVAIMYHWVQTIFE